MIPAFRKVVCLGEMLDSKEQIEPVKFQAFRQELYQIPHHTTFKSLSEHAFLLSWQ